MIIRTFNNRVRASQNSILRLFVMTLVVAGFSAVATGAQPDSNTTASRPQSAEPAASPASPPAASTILAADQIIKNGDILSVLVFQEGDLSLKVRVSLDGTINYPLVGAIHVSGLTVLAAEEKIAELLGKDYLTNPRVTVTVETNRFKRVTLIGQVRSPGNHDIPEGESSSLLQVIVRAGGFTDIAARDRVSVIRSESGKEQIIRVNVSAIMKTGDKSKDIELQSGDIVSVPETFF